MHCHYALEKSRGEGGGPSEHMLKEKWIALLRHCRAGAAQLVWQPDKVEFGRRPLKEIGRQPAERNAVDRAGAQYSQHQVARGDGVYRIGDRASEPEQAR